MRSVVACLLLGTACSGDFVDEEVVDLVDFPAKSIEITVGTQVQVRLHYPSPYNTCLVLSDELVVTAGEEDGGEPLAIDRGAFHSRMDGYPDCNEPHASLDHLPQAATGWIVIADGTSKITCHLGPAFVGRGATTLVPDGPWVGTPGQRLTVRWPSRGDLAARQMSVKIGDQETGALYHTYPDYELLSFIVPLLPIGTHRLEIRSQSTRGGSCQRVEPDDIRGSIDTELNESATLATFSVDLEII
jgi:hypothetical protein